MDGSFNSETEELQYLREEYKRLKDLVIAYEAVLDLSNEELLSAKDIIKAQENVIEFSGKELKILRADIERLITVDSLLETELMNVLSNDTTEEEKLLSILEKIRSRSEGKFAVDILRVLTGLIFSSEEADLHWGKILEHNLQLKNTLGRTIGFRVSILDYFTNFTSFLKSPKIMEMTAFSSMIRHAVIDELTGLYNRRFLSRAFEKEMKRAKRYGHSLSVVVGDIDFFKKINDSFGHNVGDLVLVGVAEIFRNHSRSEDIPCRFGGEEFLFLLPEINASQAFIFTDRIRKEIESKEFNIPHRVTMSFGISHFPGSGDSFNELLVAADEGLYRAKESGRNQIKIIQK